eukprot:TRINITY_DN17314_c0_g1_i5.p1 TRINITY_DN17314_c0_g1~~TRINITY_DN17314_c0_g1_i5.p1  ORF type:complete len:304 (-),score=49.40 TRINITY_DN17314_c0_g1_i5:114-1025(-)
MLSAKAPVERTTIQSFESGATDFVAKPFHPEILRKKVAAVLSLRMSGVRLTAAVVAASEACQRLNQDDMEATTAKEHPADLQAKLNETVVRAAEAIEKAKHLELELVSVKKSSELQKTENLELSKLCDDVLMQRKESQLLLLSTKVQSNAKCEWHSSDHLESAALIGRTSCRRNADSVSNASHVINLLVSRLHTCRKNAEKCKKLLCGFLRLPVLGADDTTVLEPSDSENSGHQLKQISFHTRVAISKLALLEDVASNIGGILESMGDGEVSTDKDVSRDCEAQVHPSRSTSKSSTCSSTVEI